MLSFESDYIEGAHEKILQRLLKRIWNSSQAMEQISIVNWQKRKLKRPATVRRRMRIS